VKIVLPNDSEGGARNGHPNDGNGGRHAGEQVVEVKLRKEEPLPTD
jgi:hypothetical protein